MKSITLVNADGTEFFVGLVPATFNVARWLWNLQQSFQLLQVAKVKVRDVATG